MKRRSLAFVALALVVVMTSVGCGSRPITGSWFKHCRSYDYEGEKVQLRMLTKADMKSYSRSCYTDDAALDTEWKSHLQDCFPSENWDEDAAPIAAVALPILVGMGIDAVKAELEKEAALYEAQFGRTIHETGFWIKFEKEGDVWKGTPRWLGFELIRKTKGDAADGDLPASRMVFAMIPANRFRRHEGPSGTAPDERLFVIKPVWFEVNRTRAKVSFLGSEADVLVNIRIGALWIDPNQGTKSDTVATADFEFKGVDLNGRARKDGAGKPLSLTRVYITDLKPHIAGWFAGIPVSFDHQKNPKGDGTFHLSMSVTESDPSQAKEIIERAAKYLGDNKQSIIDKVGGGNSP